GHTATGGAALGRFASRETRDSTAGCVYVDRMETRRLGGDGPPVTRLGIGLAALGRPAYITIGHDADFPEGRSPEDMERHAHAVLDAAYAASVRYFDAARSYGRAELFLRSW